MAGPPMQLSPEAKAGFEEGVGLIFSQWTALCLAVEQQWGGPDSEAKADYLIDDVVQWFYKKKEHYVDDLEMELVDGLLEDFQLEAEDGSPRQVATSLIALYQACCHNDAGPLQQLRQQYTAGGSGAAGSRPVTGGADAEGSSSSDEDDMDEDMQEAPAAVPMSAAAAAGAAQPRPGPIVDDDGFELVQTRRGRR